MSCAGDNYVVPGADPCTEPPSLFIGQYFKLTNQTLTSGATDVIFNALQPWNNSDGYIQHTSGTSDFTVVKTGLYQLEFNVSILGTSSTSTDLLKQISINITRAPLTEQVTIAQNASIPSGRSYGQSVNATFYLLVGDVVDCRVSNTFTGVAVLLGLANSFDLNTWFTWRYIN